MAESAESTESNVDLPYRKSGHNDHLAYPLDQRFEISPAVWPGDKNSPPHRPFSDGDGGGAGRKSGHSKDILAGLGASIAAVILAAGIVVAIDYVYRPVLDGNGHPVVLRGSAW